MPSVGLRVAAFREKYEELVMCRHHDKDVATTTRRPAYFCSPPPTATKDGLLLTESLPSAST
jgi:hypothetical protein